MKKLQTNKMVIIQAGSPKACWTTAAVFAVLPFTTGIGVAIGAACLISSL